MDEEHEFIGAGSESVDQRTTLDARNFSKKANLISGSDDESEGAALDEAEEITVLQIKGTRQDKDKVKQDLIARKRQAANKPRFDAPAVPSPTTPAMAPLGQAMPASAPRPALPAQPKAAFAQPVRTPLYFLLSLNSF